MERSRTTGSRIAWAALLVAAQLLAGTALAADADSKTVLLDESGGNDPVVLILPLNVAVVMPPELTFRSPLVWDAITGYLELQPVRLKTVAFESARALWLGSIQQVRSAETTPHNRYDEAARVFVKELGKHAQFDHVIAPSLYIREASVVRGVGEWDGVRRTLQVDAEGAEYRRRIAATPFEGVAPGASLHVSVFDADGKKLQEKVAGLDLIARVVIPRTPNAETGQMVVEFKPRPDFFGEPEDLREGIAAALEPFLEPPAD